MAERLTTVLQVDDLATAVAHWRAALGAVPSFVDGDRWAQFDIGATRLALAGTDRTDGAGVLIKVPDLDAEHARLTAAGLGPGPISVGAHERRFTLAGPGGLAVFYAMIVG